MTRARAFSFQSPRFDHVYDFRGSQLEGFPWNQLTNQRLCFTWRGFLVSIVGLPVPWRRKFRKNNKTLNLSTHSLKKIMFSSYLFIYFTFFCKSSLWKACLKSLVHPELKLNVVRTYDFFVRIMNNTNKIKIEKSGFKIILVTWLHLSFSLPQSVKNKQPDRCSHRHNQQLVSSLLRKQL